MLKIHRLLILFTIVGSVYLFYPGQALLVLPVQAWIGSQTGLADVTLYVDGATGDDNNPGLDAQPLKTIQAAVDKAIANKRNHLSTHVIVRAGVYRETVNLEKYTNHPDNAPDNETFMIFEALPTGSVIVSGSDVWDGWTAIGNQRYTHAWQHDWGLGPDLAEAPMPALVRRREMVFVDGELFTQVLSTSTLTDKTFYVDETTNLITLQSATPVTTVEVALREKLWWQAYENNVTVRGFVFQHAATPWGNGFAAVRWNGSRQITLADLAVQWNNGIGLFIGESNAVSLDRVIMNNNGKDGLSLFKVKDLALRHSETSFNNWRGRWGGYYHWWIGNKLSRTRDILIQNHLARGNYSHGLWADIDNQRMIIEDSLFEENARAGLVLEANQGPVEVRNSTLQNNGEDGLRGVLSEKVTVHGLVLRNNGQSNLYLHYDPGFPDGRDIPDFETDTVTRLRLRDWTFDDNISMIDTGVIRSGTGNAGQPGALVRLWFPDGALPQDNWPNFLATFSSDQNQWTHTARADVFQINNTLGMNNWTNRDLCGWREQTGQDLASNFAPFPLACTSAQLPATNAAPIIDGVIDAPWISAPRHAIMRQIVGDAGTASADLAADFRAIHDAQNLYVLVTVTDDQLVNDSVDATHPDSWWNDDAVEIFIDGNQSGGDVYDGQDDFQLIFSADGHFYVGPHSVALTLNSNQFVVKVTPNGYQLEVAIPLTQLAIAPAEGITFGFDVHVDDDDGAGRDQKLAWHSINDLTWQQPSEMGIAKLGALMTIPTSSDRGLYLPMISNATTPTSPSSAPIGTPSPRP